MNKPMTAETIHVVFYDQVDGRPPHAAKINHGDDMVGTNLVAIVHGRLCSRKHGCQWCTGLRDRIRSRTVR